MDSQKTQNHQNVLREKNQAGGIQILDFKAYYKSLVIETASFWHKNQHTDEWNRIESSEINSHTCSQLILDKVAKKIC